MASFIDQVGSLVLSALAVLIPAATAAILAWLRSKTQRRTAVQAALEVEQAALERAWLRGVAKLVMAVELVQERSGALTRLSRARTEELIEDVLPDVRRRSERPRHKPVEIELRRSKP